MVGGLAALTGGAEQDLEVLAELGLAVELGQVLGPEADLFPLLGRKRRRDQHLLSHLAAARSFKASRISVSTSPSDGSSRNTSRTSSGW